LIQDFILSVLRPTNCKYNKLNNKLWVTSAYEGLTDSQKELYPDSGCTFVYDVQ
jgi:hypothetical protein